jgi:AraC-like DNA-binding protein
MGTTSAVSRFVHIVRVGPYRDARRHQHPTWELALYTHGSGHARIGDQTLPIAPGAIICYPPEVPHDDHGDTPLTGFFVQAEAAPWRSRPIPVGRDGDDGIVARLMGLMHERALRQDEGDTMQAWHELLLAQLRHRVRAGEPPHPDVEHLRQAIAERFRDPRFSIEAATRPLGLSRDHLRRLFAQATGATPRRYLVDLRIAYARNLLAYGASVTEAAEAVGFADPYYFSRAFLRATGRRPSAWRDKGSVG